MRSRARSRHSRRARAPGSSSGHVPASRARASSPASLDSVSTGSDARRNSVSGSASRSGDGATPANGPTPRSTSPSTDSTSTCSGSATSPRTSSPNGHPEVRRPIRRPERRDVPKRGHPALGRRRGRRLLLHLAGGVARDGRSRDRGSLSRRLTARVGPPRGGSELSRDHLAPVLEAVAVVERLRPVVLPVHVEHEAVQREVLVAGEFDRRSHQVVGDAGPPVVGDDE
jgi:hypothetical protein